MKEERAGAVNPGGAYDLSALGWLLFEQLSAGWLERVIGLHPEWWVGSADRYRYAVLESGVPASISGTPLPGPTLVTTAWAARESSDPAAVSVGTLREAWRVATRARADDDDPLSSLLVLSNLSAGEVTEGIGLVTGPPYDRDEILPVHVVGAQGLGEAIDEDLPLRLEHPYAMGVRRGGPLLPARARESSTFDIDAAGELARVYVPSGPYRRVLETLRSHGFCVITGPPEMGKTAAARVIGLALLSEGWEVHECTTPDQVAANLKPDRPQLFVADDAFGSTEYRPEAAERWARALPEILRATDERHWLIWTSRPTPLKAGLRAIHRERGSERFPAPAEVQVDASDLDAAEKALILLRHVKRAELALDAHFLVRRQGPEIVDHRHFTPERIRRFVEAELSRLAAGDAGPDEIAEAVHRQIEHPTAAMAASYLALNECQRAVLVAMLDCPAGAVSERDLAAAARRHAPAGLDRAPFDLVDRLADHFLRMSGPTGVTWVHPSWRDLVIAQLAGDPAGRARFLSGCGQHGALLAMSVAGGAEGATRLPLLGSDADWDTLGDRLAELIRVADERSLGELLTALFTALEACEDAPRERAELSSLAAMSLILAGRTRPAHDPVGVGLIEAWLRLAEAVPDGPMPPWLPATWIDLLPRVSPDPDSAAELSRYEDWILLAQAVQALRASELSNLGFPGDQPQIARELAHSSRKLIMDAPDSPRAMRVSALLLQVTDVLDQHDPAFSSALVTEHLRRRADVKESSAIRGRHASAAAADHELVDRVLQDLRPPQTRPEKVEPGS